MNIDLAGKRVALVGGAGFIGHNIALKLKKLGAEPHIIDSLQVNNLGAFTHNLNANPNNKLYVGFINERLDLLRQADIPLHIVDARDYALLSPHLGSIKPDFVIQLAAVAHANRANKDPYSTFDHSMRTLENALDSVRDRKPHLIFFSSSMVYGNFEGEAVTEERVCEPLGIYGALKYGGEKLVIAYNQVFGLPYTIVRPSALYGERCVSRRVGQAFIENAVRGLDVTINGDGTDCLDFTYIDDLVQGILLCMGREAARNQIFNLTYGNGRSLNDMAEILKTQFPAVRVQHNPRDALMPERGTLNIDKARRLLGYEPAYPLDRGYVSYIQWYKTRGREAGALRPERPSASARGQMTAAVAIRRGFTVHPDAWLTDVLDRPAFRVVDVDTPSSAWKNRLQSDDLFLTAKLGADQVADASLLQDLGFRTIDAALTFEASVVTAPAADPRVRFARAEDRAAVTQLAGSAFVFSRFHLDPAIPTWLAHRVKAAWADNFFTGKRGDGMVVAEHAGAVVGFLQLLWSRSDALVIDLIAVAPQSARSGLARAMIGFAAVNGVGDARRPRGFRVGTQAANTPSVRLYESLGFRLSQAQFVLHHHGRNAIYLPRAGA